MLLVNQDKNKIIGLEGISVRKCFILDENNEIIGIYNSDEEAQEVFNKIIFNSNQDRQLYELPQKYNL